VLRVWKMEKEPRSAATLAESGVEEVEEELHLPAVDAILGEKKTHLCLLPGCSYTSVFKGAVLTRQKRHATVFDQSWTCEKDLKAESA